MAFNWHKLVAVICLVVQLWGGAGMGYVRVCVRPEVTETTSCACCQKERSESAVKLGEDHSEGCCLQAALPDEARVFTGREHSDVDVIVGAVDVLGSELAPADGWEGRFVAMGASGPPPLVGLASTRLRL